MFCVKVFVPSVTDTTAVYEDLVSKSIVFAAPVNESTPVDEFISISEPETE